MIVSCAWGSCSFFFFNDTATTEIYTLSLHDALPIWTSNSMASAPSSTARSNAASVFSGRSHRSEEHTSELQSRQYLVCRLLLEKKKNTPPFTLLRTANTLSTTLPHSIPATIQYTS